MENEPSEIDLSDDVMSYDRFRQEVLQDYKIARESREVSLLGRREVLTGKAKFGIFGDGKEVAQIAMAKFFKNGDFRAGYYRDQTFMFSSGLATIEQFFAQLYADPDIKHDPFSAGRQMNSHFATPFVNEDGTWLDLANRKNISSDIAPTAAQMPRALGLALASKALRSMPDIEELKSFSNNGNEICFCTIGDASTSEGHFWETLNAAGVMQVPLAVFVWDDGFGISVPKKFQTTKGSISEAMAGLQKTKFTNGINIYKVNGWDYAGMCEVFEAALAEMRETHVPALFHVEELTQPQGHSTSGSHERYKSHERLMWEKDWDCIKKFREWIIANGLASEDELSEIEAAAKTHARDSKARAWANYIAPIKKQVEKTLQLLNTVSIENTDDSAQLKKMINELQTNHDPLRRDVMKILSVVLQMGPGANEISEYYKELKQENKLLYNSHLFNEGSKSALKVAEIKPSYNTDAAVVNGFEVLNKFFDLKFTADPRLFVFGEDVGKIGDVNQGFSGLQEKHGANRIFDTGIRELSIMGQGMGMALRGLRPIAEIQYLDYLLYGLQPLSDDLSTLHYRTKGRQSCPLIVRTRGHRLEGIWHSGSPMGMIINALRGLYICVPRSMVQAAGMYNTLLQANDPALMIEALNGYRLKEKVPNNLSEFTVPLGVPEVLQKGEDITVVSYGSMLRIIHDAAATLQKLNISCEIIDIQTLLPFDIHYSIVESLKKTNRIVFIDEDGPGGSTAFMFNEVIEKQGGYRFLDVAARTITAQPHRPAYGSDGDYFSKPNEQDIVEVILEMMAE